MAHGVYMPDSIFQHRLCPIKRSPDILDVT